MIVLTILNIYLFSFENMITGKLERYLVYHTPLLFLIIHLKSTLYTNLKKIRLNN